MRKSNGGRAPVSQKPHVIVKPEHPEYVGGTISIEINEKKIICTNGYNHIGSMRRK